MTYWMLMWVFVYLLGINSYGFLLMFLDKRSAQKGHWRTPEKQLMLSGILGGVPGALAGMIIFRHKTKHKMFCIGLPVILLLQLILGIVLFYSLAKGWISI